MVKNIKLAEIILRSTLAWLLLSLSTLTLFIIWYDRLEIYTIASTFAYSAYTTIFTATFFGIYNYIRGYPI